MMSGATPPPGPVALLVQVQPSSDMRLPLVPKVKYLPLDSVTVAGSWQLICPSRANTGTAETAATRSAARTRNFIEPPIRNGVLLRSKNREQESAPRAWAAVNVFYFTTEPSSV